MGAGGRGLLAFFTMFNTNSKCQELFMFFRIFLNVLIFSKIPEFFIIKLSSEEFPLRLAVMVSVKYGFTCYYLRIFILTNLHSENITQ